MPLVDDSDVLVRVKPPPSVAVTVAAVPVSDPSRSSR